jgi:hypothetical protein
VSSSSPEAGWYADPELASGERYWTGTAWGEQRRPRVVLPTQPPPPTGAPSHPLTPFGEQPVLAVAPSSTTWAIAVTLVLAVVGLIVGYQPVTLLSGSGILYVGLAIAAGGAVLAFVMKLRMAVRIVAVVAVALVVANVVTVEHSLSQTRHQIQRDLSNLGS